MNIVSGNVDHGEDDEEEELDHQKKAMLHNAKWDVHIDVLVDIYL